jgi:hypothetical protein
MTRKVSVSILGVLLTGFISFIYVNKDNVENVFVPARELKDSAKVDSCRIDSIVIDSIK